MVDGQTHCCYINIIILQYYDSRLESLAPRYGPRNRLKNPEAMMMIIITLSIVSALGCTAAGKYCEQ